MDPQKPRSGQWSRFSTTAARKHRSEEHTSELQSQSNLVCRLLLEKKKDHLTGSLQVYRDSVEELRHFRHVIRSVVAVLHEDIKYTGFAIPPAVVIRKVHKYAQMMF